MTTSRIADDLVADLLRRHDRYGPWKREGVHWVIKLDRASFYEVNTQVGTPTQWLRHLRLKRWATPEVIGWLVMALVDHGHLS
jgi:hypothetical protein